MTPEELRAARSLLAIDQVRLAELSRVSLSTIRRFEGGKSIGSLHHDALRRAVERAGVAIVPAGTPVAGSVAVGGVVLRHRPDGGAVPETE